MLRRLSAEAILAALTTGKMQAQGSALSEAERRAAAEYASGSRLGAATYGAPGSAKPNLCVSTTRVADFAHAPSWNGWSTEPTNTRFQSKAAGGLSAADLPKLRLKWAFGYVNVSALRAQPTVFGHRVFAASDTGEIYALDAKTGCTYWVYKAQGSIAAALSVGPYQNSAGAAGFAVYAGDHTATVYALDAQTGSLLWKRKVDEHPAAGITGAPTLYQGRLYVPVQGVGEEGTGSSNGYACCTFRGSLSQLDASTGEVIWKTYTMAEPAPRGRSPSGVQSFGPAGAAIWSAPTIDVDRELVYVGTGNGYSDPPQPGTDAIVAMDIKTGSIRWMKQVAAGDIWAMGCGSKNGGNPSCPSTLGPDYDFSASPALVRAAGRDILIAVQKSGLAFALDPDKRGEVLWQYRFGQGSGLGGQWGGAIEGNRFFIGTADLLTSAPGGMHALNVADGKPVWVQSAQPKLCLKNPGQSCSAGQGGALTSIPGAVLNAGLDGGLRAYSSRTGRIIWLYDTNRDFATVNGVTARGGGMDHGGPVVADGMLYVNSGYGGFVGHPGNILLAFGLP
jgi:polyvinyl alcohol dehydrogenase (cytochrome)